MYVCGRGRVAEKARLILVEVDIEGQGVCLL